jgi:hypothetical protein
MEAKLLFRRADTLASRAVEVRSRYGSSTDWGEPLDPMLEEAEVI